MTNLNNIKPRELDALVELGNYVEFDAADEPRYYYGDGLWGCPIPNYSTNLETLGHLIIEYAGRRSKVFTNVELARQICLVIVRHEGLI